jgi:CubicO group peptidase (beta-lactamase class C family)
MMSSYQASFPPIRPAELEEYFQRLEAGGFSGAALVAVRGEILLHAGYGLADEANRTPVETNTVFDIGSITKSFTAAAILHLEMSGGVRVTDPVGEYFDDVPPDKASITLHHLLTHSAGFTQDHFEHDLTPLTKTDALRAIFAQELGFTPSSQYHYANTGYTLLAMIIETASGGTYTSYLKTQIFERLGMNQTGFYGENIWETLPVANGYFNNQDQEVPSHWPGPYWGVMGNGGVMSTVGDLYTWWQALQDQAFLDQSQIKKLFTRHILEDSGDSYYGYGWTLMDTKHGKLITHNGGGIGGNSDLAAYKDQDLVIIIASNRIVLEFFPDGNPRKIRLPATEARAQLADNIMSGDYSRLPRATFG